MVIATAIVIGLAILFTMLGDDLVGSVICFLVAGLALILHVELGWNFWLAPGFFVLGVVVLHLTLKRQAKYFASLYKE